MNTILQRIAGAGLAMAVVIGGAAAQTRVDAKKDWSIFEAGEGAQKVCWIVSQPTKSTAERDGKPVEVKRGDIFLMVAVRKADNVKNEISFLSGYPFKQGSKVNVTVNSSRGGEKFDLFTDGENAWTDSQTTDDKLTGAMRSGRDAVVTGQSRRGTQTTDTFSLSGFTAAIGAAQSRCQ